LTFIEKSPIEVSPIIVILIGIFWDDLIARRATGRKLTELLLDKVDLVFSTLSSVLIADIQVLKISHPCSSRNVNFREASSYFP
jgi:hypothetical protein